MFNSDVFHLVLYFDPLFLNDLQKYSLQKKHYCFKFIFPPKYRKKTTFFKDAGVCSYFVRKPNPCSIVDAESSKHGFDLLYHVFIFTKDIMSQIFLDILYRPSGLYIDITARARDG